MTSGIKIGMLILQLDVGDSTNQRGIEHCEKVRTAFRDYTEFSRFYDLVIMSHRHPTNITVLPYGNNNGH
jgi:hypothetical protein